MGKGIIQIGIDVTRLEYNIILPSNTDQSYLFYINHSLNILARLPNNSINLHSYIQGPPRPRIITYSLHFPRYYLRYSIWYINQTVTL